MLTVEQYAELETIEYQTDNLMTMPSVTVAELAVIGNMIARLARIVRDAGAESGGPST
jgi:hypothetical protein